MGIWSRKTVEMCTEEAFSSKGPQLRRSLGVVGLTAFGVGCTIGAGIFSLTGAVAAHQAGPAVSLSFVLASVACFFAGLCYAEFAAMVPVSGSAYTYAYVTLGELVAWLIGWNLVLEWLFSASVVAVSWSGYTTAALRELGIVLPGVLTSSPLKVDDAGHLVASGAYFNVPAVLVVAVCTLLLLVGTRASSLVNTVMVLAKIVALVLLVAVGARYVRAENWHPFVPANTGQFGHFGWSGVARGAGTLLFAYLGFDGVSTLAAEARDPQRAVPWSLFASLLVCTLLYTSVSIVVTGIANYRFLDVPDPLYYALSAYRASIAPIRYLVSIVAVVGLVSVVLTCILGQARIFYAMARDGLLPPALERVTRVTGVPSAATILTGAVAGVVAGLVPLDILGELVSIGTLMAFAAVCAGIPILRRIAPDAHRPFRAPWVPVIPALGVLSCTALMFSLPPSTWVRLILWIAAGLLIYAAYGRHHSRLRARSLALTGGRVTGPVA